MAADRNRAFAKCAAAAAALTVLSAAQAGEGQETPRGLIVSPVRLEMKPGQMAAELTIKNLTGREADFQVRPYAWSQPDGSDRLTPTEALMVSPALGRVPAGVTQVVRLMLSQPPEGQETTYRILLDQAPPPPEPGDIGLAFRFSIPVFAEPVARAGSHLRWSIQSDGAGVYLVAVNSGERHDIVNGLVLTTASGRRLALETSLVPPYVLAGATRRWRILEKDFAPSGEALHLTGHADLGEIDQTVSASSASP